MSCKKMSREFEWAPVRLGERLKRALKKPVEKSVEDKGALEPTSEEKALLARLIDSDVKRIESKPIPEGVTYEGLEEIMEEYGAQRLRQLLESLAEKGFLTVKEKEPALFCPKCDALHVYTRYTCPRCQSIDVDRAELIEHQFCGYTGVKKKFISGLSLVCPNCETDLGPLHEKPPGDGSREDYRVVGSSFECEKCGNKFNRPTALHICQKCGEAFDYKTAVYEKLHDYEIPEHVIRDMRVSEEYKILLIEDDPKDAEIITRYITEAGEIFKIEYVTSGMEGLEKIEQKHFDVILLDYLLPGMDGLKVLEEIRKRDIPTPVIMLTGADERTTAVEAMKLGASDYIVKSLEAYEKLPSTIQQIVQE